jgi:hypothetical protein
VNTFEEFLKKYRSEINPITGINNLYKDLTDETIWNEAYNVGYDEGLKIGLKQGFMNLKNKLTEEEFNELGKIAKIRCHNGKEYRVQSCANIRCDDCVKDYFKQSGIIQKSVLEEARSIQMHNIHGNIELVYFKEVKEKLDLYEKYISEVESRPLSEAVIEAREKTDKYINDLGKGFGNFNSLKQLIKSEREAVDKKE